MGGDSNLSRGRAFPGPLLAIPRRSPPRDCQEGPCLAETLQGLSSAQARLLVYHLTPQSAVRTACVQGVCAKEC